MRVRVFRRDVVVASFKVEKPSSQCTTPIPSFPKAKLLLWNTKSQKPNLDQLHDLLKQRRNQNTPNDYRVFGTYAHGNHYGNTNRTRNLPELRRLINSILKQHLPPDMVWTSFALNSGTTMPIHRDVNNDGSYPNGSVGFGNYTGGELWIEKGGFQEGYTGKLSERVDGSGRVLEGVELDIYKRGVFFSPKAWHGTCKWEGGRWVLTAYVRMGTPFN